MSHYEYLNEVMFVEDVEEVMKNPMKLLDTLKNGEYEDYLYHAYSISTPEMDIEVLEKEKVRYEKVIQCIQEGRKVTFGQMSDYVRTGRWV